MKSYSEYNLYTLYDPFIAEYSTPVAYRHDQDIILIADSIVANNNTHDVDGFTIFKLGTFDIDNSNIFIYDIKQVIKVYTSKDNQKNLNVEERNANEPL